ncbi:PQQ-binding-like beta-propeller repeat protein [Rhodococcus sp. BP-316]|uniref:outer membrane protein assembly factor BamB family protein n=1 Tax=Rhodococcus sp. BP-316 TaxID=2739445 RepID=UPI001C9A79B2|nr:PQQ-binding-like beta-propeller repeat protein [Rhodococcus sp. BP-316]MBY6682353.1 PQQ-binding-like beta-propeller repeat protein [Rhodococcus sp. BP-316]
MMHTRLIIAGTVAAVSVAAAVVVVTQDRTTTIKRITDASASAPGVAWTLDAADSGLDGARFADPRAGSMYPYAAGSIRIDDHLLTIAAVVDPEGPSTEARLMSIDIVSGALEWSVPATDLQSCAEQPIDDRLVCITPSYAEDPTLRTFDLATGESTDHGDTSDTFAMTVSDGHVYTTSGNLEDADVTVHRGTVDDLSADWTAPLQAWAGWEDQYADQLTVADGTGHFDVGGGFSTFDPETGEQIWASDVLDDCLSGSYRTLGDVSVGSRLDCDSYEPLGGIAYSRTGEILAQSASDVSTYLIIDEPTDASVPFVLSDTAYDRTTGEKRWSSDQLIIDRPADEYNEASTYGALQSVIGDVGVLSGERSTIGLDMLTGDQLWEAKSFSPVGTDGDVMIAVRESDLVAVDLHSGDEVWTAPLENVREGERLSPETMVGGEGGAQILQSGSEIVSLVRLPS